MSSPQADDLPPDPLQLAQEILTKVAKHWPELIPEASRFTTKLIRKGEPCRAGPGFTSVIWYGEEYQFNAVQSHVIRLLWRAWRRGTPQVRQEFIMEAVGSETKVSDIFKDHPAWNTMIVIGSSRGSYQLKRR